MTDNHRFTVGLIEGGRYAAASAKSPYFFFVGDSKEEVEATAKRALDFYFEDSGVVDDGLSNSKKERATLKSRFRPLTRVAA